MKIAMLIIFAATMLLISACASRDIAGKAYDAQEVDDSYAPPYDIFNNNAQIFFVELIDVSEDFLQYNIIVDHPEAIVLGKGYYYTDDWKEFEFKKESILDDKGNQWMKSPVQTTILLSRREYPTGISGVTVQSCKKQQDELLCGCKSANDCGYWMYQSPVRGGSCTSNSDCIGGENVCVDNKCGKLDAIYETQQCTKRCTLQSALITTSDGEEFSVGHAGGSYTAAEALFWTVEGGISHCPTQETRVPILIVKKNYGQNIGEEFITLKKGESSRTIYHPKIPSVAFTLKVNDVVTACP